MKAYIIAMVNVEDPETYSTYTAQTPATIAAHGGKFIARAGQAETLEGEAKSHRLVILEFPSREAATNWYNSPEYQRLKKIRQQASTSRFLIVDAVPDGLAPAANVVKSS